MRKKSVNTFLPSHTSRHYTTIAAVGAGGAEKIAEYIREVLTVAGLPVQYGKIGEVAYVGGAYHVLYGDESIPTLRTLPADITVLPAVSVQYPEKFPDGLPEVERLYRRFLRNLSPNGVVVGYGRSGSIRKLSKGFGYRFRWYDEEHLWPGLRLQAIDIQQALHITAAARVAHELGIDQPLIKQAFAKISAKPKA